MGHLLMAAVQEAPLPTLLLLVMVVADLLVMEAVLHTEEAHHPMEEAAEEDTVGVGIGDLGARRAIAWPTWGLDSRV
jgi:hypothetical protein